MWVLRFRYKGRSLSVPMLRPQLTVGREEGADVRFLAPGVSRRHCQFSLEGEDRPRLHVRDLGSRLGILRGEEPLIEAELGEGDALTLGPVWVLVQKEPTLDWRTASGLPLTFPVQFGADGPDGIDGDAGDTLVPERERVPLDLLQASLEALAGDPAWGSRWQRLLGLDALEVTCEGPSGALCLWPGPWAEPPACASRTLAEGRQGLWRAAWLGGKPGAGSTLRALLYVLDLVRGRPGAGPVPGASAPAPSLRLVALDAVWETLERLALTDLPVLLLGQTGVGKEVLARAIHRAKFGQDAPFLVIHCAAIPEPLFESELFGIEPNTASGVTGRKGKLEEGNGGTILLDEVAEIPPSVQIKLLRVLEEATVSPVGSRKAVPLKVRWLSATNVDIHKAIAEGRFREDLYYRLKGAEVTIPPLKERMDSLPALVDLFLGQLETEARRGLQGLSMGAYRAVMAYPWPGNIRELKMEIKRAYHLADQGGMIQVRHLSPAIRAHGEHDPGAAAGELDRSRRSAAAATIRDALTATSGNITLAAEHLGVTRQTLTKHLKDLSIDAKEFKSPSGA